MTIAANFVEILAAAVVEEKARTTARPNNEKAADRSSAVLAMSVKAEDAAGVTGFAIVNPINAEQVAEVTLRTSASGNVTAYVNVYHGPKAKGVARGGGYDKYASALLAALNSLDEDAAAFMDNEERATVRALRASAAMGEGRRAYRILEDTGMRIYRVS